MLRQTYDAFLGSDWANLTKVRPLFMLSHRGSDNSPLNEICMNFVHVFAYFVMISANQIAYFKRNELFLKMTKVVYPTFSRIKSND